MTKIEWTDKTVNPVVGCAHGCPYCYARRQAKRQKQRCKDCYDFKPHAHLERLEQIKPTQKPKRIFINSMWDWNSPGVNPNWNIKILEKFRECHDHIFQILSKAPMGYQYYEFPSNVWLGATVNTDKDAWRIDALIASARGNLKFISYEPAHGPIHHDLKGIDWVIIGAETGNRKGKQPTKKEWVSEIITRCRALGIPVFLKSNLKWPEIIQEFPK